MINDSKDNGKDGYVYLVAEPVQFEHQMIRNPAQRFSYFSNRNHAAMPRYA
jgi:hypothetical protein